MLDVWIGIHTLTSQDTSHETDYETNVVESIILEPNSSTSSDKHAKDTTSIFMVRHLMNKDFISQTMQTYWKKLSSVEWTRKLHTHTQHFFSSCFLYHSLSLSMPLASLDLVELVSVSVGNCGTQLSQQLFICIYISRKFILFSNSVKRINWVIVRNCLTVEHDDETLHTMKMWCDKFQSVSNLYTHAYFYLGWKRTADPSDVLKGVPLKASSTHTHK